MFKFLSLFLLLVVSKLAAQDAVNFNWNGLKQCEVAIVNYKNGINTLAAKQNLFLNHKDGLTCRNTVTPINNAVKYEAFF